ncbi:Mediator of RNA polymerase II transcription subunit 33A [Rhynchospora pubera]|uniref:Mediator of RNA polymerase II transcription subunit 33A n=1 Tax=Rhynchospora pubera TaxID=906938 RepID=A0AAV8GMY8_9POAL|nr:Mediator of RNA polymerase II transcription subunit 33A [Rhynchospora pubera]
MLHVSGREGLIKPERTLDYLLYMYKANRISTNFNRNNADCSIELFYELPCGSKYIDTFRKLQQWHFQNQACLASIGSALPCNGTVLTVVNKILNMIFCKRIKGEQVVPINTSIGTAWEVLESVPYVLEAALTACSYGQLSPRELTTGLKDLVDFFPASVAVVVSYLSAEITGGVWKNVSMNGIDWPSPSEALYTFQSEVMAVLASVGVEIGSCYPYHTPPMLPLPLAVLLSVTITWKLDESARYTRSIVGLALGNNSLYCNWLSMLTLGALWIQKAPKWQDFLAVTCSGSPFTHDQNAVGQLVHSCFKVFLGLDQSNSSYFCSNQGVVGLLGPSIANIHGLSPGVFFLRNCHLFCDLNFFSELILKSVIEFASILVDKRYCAGPTQLASGSISLAAATIAARQSASLGASLLCVTGNAKTVQVLFEETVPIFLLPSDTKRHQTPSSISSMLKGYAISYFMFLSCALVSGFWDNSTSTKLGTSQRQARIVASHLNFIAGVFEGRIVLGCDPTMWKTHVMCFLDMLVRFAPAWITSVKLDTLQKVSVGLRNWHEYDLALSLLEFGGIGAIEKIVESFF